jgi:N-acetylneuraminate synthase/N,N'-diacetyllegionaminate synthase
MPGWNGAQLEIIAEIGQNHNGDMTLARRLIAAAKAAGASVAKFQVYDARALFPVEGNEWFDYNCRTELSRADVEMLAAECARVGIEFMASAFDVERVHWLEQVGVQRYKIASRSVRDQELINACASTGRRLIVSLGMWGQDGFPEVRAAGGVDFLYCISKYPTSLSEVKLGKVDFTRYAGFSDHTVGLEASMAALARGAQIIEKHFTLDKTMYGPDHACSMTPQELTDLSRFRDRLVEVL